MQCPESCTLGHPQHDQGPTERTAGQGLHANVWHGTSSAMALPGKDCSLSFGAQWAPCALVALTRAPGTLQIVMAMNTGGQGREGTGHTAREGRKTDGSRAWYPAGLYFYTETREKGTGTGPGYHSLPLQPGTGCCSHGVPAGGARSDPKTQGRGGCKCPALPGCLTQCWQQETGPGNGVGRSGLKPWVRSTALLLPEGPGAPRVLPPRTEGISTAL